MIKIYLLCQNFTLANDIRRKASFGPQQVEIITNPRSLQGLTCGVFALLPKRTKHGTTLNTDSFYNLMREIAHSYSSRYPRRCKYIAILPSELNDHVHLMNKLAKIRDEIPA